MLVKLEHGDSQSSSDPGANVGILLFIKFGQAKVRYFGVKVLVEQHISGLYVSVNNLQPRFFM